MSFSPDDFNFAALTRTAKDVFRDHIHTRLACYKIMIEQRRMRLLPVLCFCGYGRSGKGEASAWLGETTSLIYGGRFSTFVLPMIAYSIGIPQDEAWRKRHDDPTYGRQYWFHWCNAFRVDDPTLLAKGLLGVSDIAPGIRGREELMACVADRVIDVPVWVERPGTPVDPTVEYTKDDVMALPRAFELVNDGTLDDFRRKTTDLARTLGIPTL